MCVLLQSSNIRITKNHKTAPFSKYELAIFTKELGSLILSGLPLYEAMISLEEKEPMGILIHEKNFYETHQMMFDILWESLY